MGLNCTWHRCCRSVSPAWHAVLTYCFGPGDRKITCNRDLQSVAFSSHVTIHFVKVRRGLRIFASRDCLQTYMCH